ncbi:hypothetical protein D9758_003087 [Tetrapyrgos nigripes]|uniref:UDP-glycosyltransferase n=1 Tax=Tetrapyrgos nigripes TaxID=182062 RepID=A0A8H5GQI5_9AGAR|nr:hypothetical protein D9758_003087 [Tetrapyrgos nigripes]
MTVTAPPDTHAKNIFFWTMPLAWGHCKPIAAFGVRILEARANVHITVFLISPTYPKLLGEVDRIAGQAKIPKEDILRRFHVIDICKEVSFETFLTPNAAFAPAFEALWNGGSIKCLSSGKVYDKLPRPTIAVIDPFQGYAIEVVREISFPSGRIPIFTWMTCNAGASLQLFGPKKLGAAGPSGRLDVKTVRYGTLEDIQKLGGFNSWTGKLLEIPGVPTMYDYEMIPQDAMILKGTSIIEENGRVYIPDCDGMFTVSTSAFDGEAMNVMNNWFDSMGHTHYSIGPLTIPKAGEDAIVGDNEKDATLDPVVGFLDQMQAKCGVKSVVYVSFGSVFWPVNQDHFWAMIEEFLKNDMPLILAHPAAFGAAPSEERLQMLRDSPIAMELVWAPQETILAHPATGWFISHGGWNGTQEALEYRVPQIFWPFGGDQPYNAAQMSRVHEAGFELFNVRTGERGQQIPYVFEASNRPAPTFTLEAVQQEVKDIILKLKGEEGKIARRNLEALAENHLRSWGKNGEARRNMEAFLRRLLHALGLGHGIIYHINIAKLLSLLPSKLKGLKPDENPLCADYNQAYHLPPLSITASNEYTSRHTKPLAFFGIRILEARPNVVVTVFTSSSVYSQFLDEIKKISGYSKLSKQDIRKRFRVVDIFGPQDMAKLLEPDTSAVTAAFTALWNGEPFKCLSSGEVFSDLPRPVVVVIDPCQSFVYEAVREITLPSGKLPIYSWMAATIGACLRLFGPKELGTVPASGRLDVKTVRFGTTEDIAKLGKFYTPPTGKLVEIPGLPTMYDYEYSPQDVPEFAVGSMVEECSRIYIPHFDGMFSTSTSVFEEKAMTVWTRWLESMGRVHYPVGPLIEKAEVHHARPETADPVGTFLDQMQARYGEHSVVYVSVISFGSVLYPSDQDKLRAVVEEFLKNELPVVLAHAGSALVANADNTLQLVRDSPIEMALTWAPQELILSHPATGWFLSHAGWSSIQEALVYRVPQLSRTHKAAFELFNIRSANSQTPFIFENSDRPPTFTLDAVKDEIKDLIARLRGEEGLTVRNNLRRLADEHCQGWEENGEARQNLEAFLRKSVDPQSYQYL